MLPAPLAHFVMLTSSFACSLTSAIAEEITEDGNIYIEITDPTTDKLDTQPDPAMKKQKKKARKTRARRKSSKDSEG